MFTWRNSTHTSATWDIGSDASGVTIATIKRDPDGSWAVFMASDVGELSGGPYSREQACAAVEDEWKRRSEARSRTSFGAG